MTLADAIRTKTLQLEADGFGETQSAWDDTNPDNQFFVLSEEEARVLDIDPELWPRMFAALRAFEEYSGFCPCDEFTEDCWEEVRRDHPEIPADVESIEAFAAFCAAYAGLTAEEAYRAWYKWQLWHLRMGYLYCLTAESEREETDTSPRSMWMPEYAAIVVWLGAITMIFSDSGHWFFWLAAFGTLATLCLLERSRSRTPSNGRVL
jgi:hypothetical protein